MVGGKVVEFYFKRFFSFNSIFFVWILIGQIVYFSLLNGLFSDFFIKIISDISDFVPSIYALGNYDYLFLVLSKYQAASVFALTPILFFVMLFVDFGVKKNEFGESDKLILAFILCLVLGLGIFFSGFNYRGPMNIFRTSFFAFSVFSSVLTYLSAYCLRLAVLIAFRK